MMRVIRMEALSFARVRSAARRYVIVAAHRIG